MTGIEETINAMRKGAMPMFLVGLLEISRRDPAKAHEIVNRSAAVFYEEKEMEQKINQKRREVAAGRLLEQIRNGHA